MNQLLKLADKLWEMQAKENDGRGIECVRSLILYLRRNNPESARAVYLNESDKIRSYPAIFKLIKQELAVQKEA